MIFTSLQVLRNSYKYNYENTNIFSKNFFAIYFLNYFYHSLLLKRLLNFLDKNIQVAFFNKILQLKVKKIYFITEFYNVDFFYYISGSWCIILFKVLEFTALNPSVFRLKPLKKKKFAIKPILYTKFNRYLN